MESEIFLIHWNAAEAQAYTEDLRSAGWSVVWESEDGARAGRAIRENPARIVVINLSRLPSHGRETAYYLRSVKATRHIPIVFVDGKGESLEKTKAKIPDAIYTSYEDLQEVLSKFQG